LGARRTWGDKSLSEQAQTITAPETPARVATIVLPGETRGSANGSGERRPNRGMQRKNKGAPARILELLAEVKNLKSQREQDRIEAQAALAMADEQIEKLREELLAVHAENDDYKSREEQRLFDLQDAGNAREQEAVERLELCLKALIDAAHQSGAYQRHPDFDSKMKRATFSTSLLEVILCNFSKEMAPELAYALANERAAIAKLSALPLVAQISWLAKIATEIENRVKFERLVR
jgi:hypothetical protein